VPSTPPPFDTLPDPVPDRRPRTRRDLAVLAAALYLLTLTVVFLVGGGSRPVTRDPSGDAASDADGGSACGDAFACWTALWQRLAAEGPNALAVSVPKGNAPAGDTVFMRHPDLFPHDDQAIRNRFALVRLITDPDEKQRRLEPMINHPDPTVRYRALLNLSEIALRRGDATEGARFARAALAQPIATPLLADAWFQAGIAALRQGDRARAAQALQQAVQADPVFWHAHQARLILALQRLERPYLTDSVCLDQARIAIETLGALVSLSGDSRLFLDLADALQRDGVGGTSARALAVGLALRWAGRDTEAGGVLRDGLDNRTTALPALCRTLIRQQLERALRPEGIVP